MSMGTECPYLEKQINAVPPARPRRPDRTLEADAPQPAEPLVVPRIAVARGGGKDPDRHLSLPERMIG